MASWETDSTDSQPFSHTHLHSLTQSHKLTMRLFGGDVAPSHYSTLQNNAAAWWWQDAGMRKLAVALGVGFAGTINGGKSCLGLRDTAICTHTDIFRIRRITHEWSFIKPALRDCHRQPRWKQAWHHICCLFSGGAYRCRSRPLGRRQIRPKSCHRLRSYHYHRRCYGTDLHHWWKCNARWTVDSGSRRFFPRYRRRASCR